MGISGLTTLLDHYSIPLTLSQNQNSRQPVFIDGPGLAYFCWGFQEGLIPGFNSGVDDASGDYGVFLKRAERVLEVMGEGLEMYALCS